MVRGLGRVGALALTGGVVLLAILLRVTILVRPDSPVAGAPWPVLRLTEFVIGIGVAKALRLGWRPPIRPGAAYLLTAAVLLAGLLAPGSLASKFTNEGVIVAFALLIAAVALRDVDGGPSLLRACCAPVRSWSSASGRTRSTSSMQR